MTPKFGVSRALYAPTEAESGFVRLGGRCSTGQWFGVATILLASFCVAIGFGGIPARGEEFLILPVPKLTIYPGDTIADDWLVEREFTQEFVAARPALVDSRAAIVGKVARRTLLPGTPVPSSAVAERKLVTHGAKVRILFEDGGLSIVAFGMALQAGSAGALVQVRNLDSGVTISGTVQEDGSVRVSGG
jgi:flagella basal body P-ring formation protein FlgA